MLIGVDYPDFHFSLKDIRGKPGQPRTRLTTLGWTCIGNPNNTTISQHQNQYTRTYFSLTNGELGKVGDNSRKFWDVEDISGKVGKIMMSSEDKMALKMVVKSVKHDGQRYEVAIPWKKHPGTCLLNNCKDAEKRLHHKEYQFSKQPEVCKAYEETINQYLTKGYIRQVDTTKEGTFLAHFPVARTDKDTTKTRIVFDASAKKEGISVNDLINTGPKLQNDLFDVLVRFRRNAVAVVCDITEMYLQIKLRPDDCKYFRFLWQHMDQLREPSCYEFQRLLFGLNSAPFEPQQISQNAKDNQKEFPLAAETVLQSTYMDDSMDSMVNEVEAMKPVQQLKELWRKAGMHPRKWLSNSKKVWGEIDMKDRVKEIDLSMADLPSVKTLGVVWSASSDQFSFSATSLVEDIVLTKKKFLSKISTLFDPLGFVTPFVVRAKIPMQEVKISGVDWDDQLPENILDKPKKWFAKLQDLGSIKIDRGLRRPTNQVVTDQSFHVFSDASEDAYASVIYDRIAYLYQFSSLPLNPKWHT